MGTSHLHDYSFYYRFMATMALPEVINADVWTPLHFNNILDDLEEAGLQTECNSG